MSVWLKRFSIIFSLITIFIVAGCDASMEKPLTKDETSEIQAAQDVNEREIRIAADVKPPKIDVSQSEEGVTESNDASESESGSHDKDTDSNGEENKETSDTETSSNESGSNEENTASNTTTNQSTSSNEQEKSTNDSSSSDNTNKNSNSNSSSQTKEESNEKPEPSKDTLVYSIVISDSEVPLSPTEVEVKEGESVLDVLIRITQDKGIQMDYRGGQGGSAYVEGIDNVYEFDRGQGSGWMYRVNGIFPDRGAGVVPLLPDDRVEWLYTTDLGQDLGADLKPFRR